MKKPALDKRASPPRSVDFTAAFLKDWRRLSRSGRYDMHRLKQVMLLLIGNDAPLGPEWRDHPLKGEWLDHRECHIGGDFLLAHKVQEDGHGGQFVFVRTGTHAELFES